MATPVNYSTNPRSYAQLLSAGVSPAQIAEAINSGLNPSQLPPEYFGLSGGWTPQPVGAGAPSSDQLGGIDIPPASMADPYVTPPPSTTFQPNVGGQDISTFGLGDYGLYTGLPSTSGIGGSPVIDIPTSSSGSMNTGGAMTLGSLPDWGQLPSSYGLNTPIDYGGGSMSSGGTMSLGSLPDWGYLPSSNQYGWTAPDYSSPASFDSSSYGEYSTGSGSLPYAEPTPITSSDPISQSAGGTDISSFGGSMDITGGQSLGYVPSPGMNYYDAGGGVTYVYDSDWNYLYTQQPTQPKGGTTSGSGTTGGGTGSPLGSGIIVTGSPSGFTGGFGVGAGPQFGITPSGFSTGYTPFGGGGVGPQFTGAGGGMGGGTSMYSGSQYGQIGLPSGLAMSTALGASTGGFMPVGPSSSGSSGGNAVARPSNYA